MIYDCHLHTAFSGDSDTPARDQLERAIALGMEELCITDHHDYGSDFCEENFELDLPAYLARLKALRAEYEGRIRLNLGIELGLQCRNEAYLRSFSRRFGPEFDFIIGSSHFVFDQDPYLPSFWQQHGEREGLRAFLEASLARVRRLTDVFDSYGHLDYIVRYAPSHDGIFSYRGYADLIDAILRLLIENGRALECNSGGYKYGLGRPNPGPEILRRYRELGGELVTIGSDAHTPQYLGFEFERCRGLLKQSGFRYYAVYRRRQASMLAL